MASEFVPQVVWSAPDAFTANYHQEHRNPWTDSRTIAAYVAVASAAIASVQALLLTPPVKSLRAKYFGDESHSRSPIQNSPEGLKERLKAHIKSHGGGVIFAYQVARLNASVILFMLALLVMIGQGAFSKENIALVSAIGYATTMNVLNTFLPSSLARSASPHATFAMLAVLGSFFYRDIWPLVTYDLVPLDPTTPLLWAQVFLAFAGTALPAFEPYAYIPVDPLKPQVEISPEQTASIVSVLFYFFLDPIIFKASKVPHLKADELPPLCDYDYAENLIKRSYKHLDPFAGASKGSSLFWGIVKVFRVSLFWQSIVLIVNAGAKLGSPIGTNRLLHYLETGGTDARVKPWFWILWLIVGPMVNTLCFQLYVFLSTGSLVRVEAIVTSLVFEHALRIRLNAQLPDTPATPAVDIEPVGLIAATDEQTAEVVLVAEESTEVPPAAEGSAEADDTLSAHSKSVSAVSVASASTSTAVGSPSGTIKGKDAKGKKGEKKEDKLRAKSDNLLGRLNNLVTSDLQNITNGRDFLFIALSLPINAILGMTFLYAILGWASFVGLAVMVILMPVPAWYATLMRGVQKEKMEATDARVKLITEALSVLRMIKLFGWEGRVGDDVDNKRNAELRVVWRRKMLELLNSCLNRIIPLVHMIATFGTLTLVMKRELSASIVFSSMAGFSMLRQQLYTVSHHLPKLIEANVSLSRLQDFLANTELLDEFAAQESGAPVVDASAAHSTEIGISAASFAWSADVSSASSTASTPGGTRTPSDKGGFRLRIEDELVFRKGEINLIVGPTGSGKTSILMALLGEMHYLPDGPGSWVSLPRAAGIAYASQESWVQNETIRDNILFGAKYDEERYKKVIYQCGLKRDLSLFEAGDATEVGEKGLTLSGGQKARITLARAVYSNAEILLLDDVLAALDVHTAKWIVDKCFQGELVRGRTVLLVTHNVALAAPIASFVVSLGSDGRILSQGSVSDAVARDSRLARDMDKDRKAIEQNAEGGEDLDEEVEVKDNKGKLIIDEEIAEGHVSWDAFKLFLGAAGGSWSTLFWVGYLLISCVAEATVTGETWWLGQWARQYSKYPGQPGKVDATFYIYIYATFVGVAIGAYVLGTVVYTLGTIRASRVIHRRLVSSLLGSTFRWLDQTPTSRVIARCTQDIQGVDSRVSSNLGWLVDMTMSMITHLAAVLLFTPIFIIPGIILAVIGGILGQIYIKAQLSVKREMSNAKSPVIGIFNGAISGLVSIRAYGAQDMFRYESHVRIDRYVRAARSFYNLNRWIATRIEALGSLFAASLATYLLYGPTKVDPSNVGFSLNMAVVFNGMILWWVRTLNDLEVEGNSLERINQYVNNEQEPQPSEDGTPPAYWPASGSLRVEKLSARYSPDGPKVLHDLSFEIKSGERVGVVGRTGSGKSSLTLSLLRCIYTDGTVYYDGIPTSSLNLDALRGNVTIIPQVPELMSGTLRHNLDMFGQHDDAVLNDALRSAGLYSLQTEADENKLTLDSPISSGGGNLSVGQRQIIALARALVRQSKVLILDEATSAIDYETDGVIQSSLRTELKGDVTIITVAHRLQTIMDSDKIMVLDAGRLVEFDSPRELLKKDGLLKSLVEESADKEVLYAIAEGKVVV